MRIIIAHTSCVFFPKTISFGGRIVIITMLKKKAKGKAKKASNAGKKMETGVAANQAEQMPATSTNQESLEDQTQRL